MRGKKGNMSIIYGCISRFSCMFLAKLYCHQDQIVSVCGSLMWGKKRCKALVSQLSHVLSFCVLPEVWSNNGSNACTIMCLNICSRSALWNLTPTWSLSLYQHIQETLKQHSTSDISWSHHPGNRSNKVSKWDLPCWTRGAAGANPGSSACW